MAAIAMVYNQSSFLRIVPCTAAASIISALGTKIDILRVVNIIPNAISTNASTETTYHTVDASNGNQYSVPDVGKNYNAITGVEIADDTGGDANESFACEVFLTFAERKTLMDHYRAGTPVFGIRDIGKNTSTQAVGGYEYILGKITEFKESPEAGPGKYSFNISADPTITFLETTPGTPDVVYTDFNSAATGAGNTLTPDNTPTLTITALAEADWEDALVLGKIVTKNV